MKTPRRARRPPRWMESALARRLPTSDRDDVLGDLAEEHAARGAGFAADRWYLAQVAAFWLRLGSARMTAGLRSRRRGENEMTSWLYDLRLAVRALRRSPGFVATAVSTLALAIGANVALITVADRAFLRPLPVPEPDRLLSVYSARDTDRHRASNYADFVDLRERSADVFSGLSAWTEWEVSARLGAGDGGAADGAAELLPAELVSAGHFAVLGLRPAVGRFFVAGAGEEAEVVLSHSLWQRAYGGDPAVVGQTVRLGSHPFTVVGVAPRGFRGLDLSHSPEVWVPLDHYDRLASGFWQWFRAVDYEEQRNTRQRVSMWSVVGRLAEGVPRERAAAAVDLVGRQLATEWPSTNDDVALIVEPTVRAATPIGDRGRAVELVVLLLGATALATLLACANLAHLLIGRATRRRGELAVRHALGAGRWRVVRQQLTESALVGGLGGLAAVAVAVGLLGALASDELPGGVPIGSLAVGLEPTTLVAAAVLSLLATLLFGGFTALRSSRAAMRGGLAAAARWERSSASARWGLVGVQMALSLVLLLGAGLFLRSLQRAMSTDLGFEPGNKLMVAVDLGMQGYDEERAETYLETLAERARAIAGVRNAGWTSSPFGVSALGIGGVDVDGGGYREDREVELSWIDAGYLDALGVPLVEGRGFDPSDTDSQILVNRTMARALWPDGSAVGGRVRFNDDDDEPWLEVIGVVADTRHFGFDGEPPLFVYFDVAKSWDSALDREMTLVVDAAVPPLRLAGPVREAFVAADPAVPVSRLETIADRVAGYAAPQRLGSILLGGFALVAALLASLGVYGVVSTAVVRRRREIGVRIALGAERREVVGLVLRESLIPATLGLAAGLALAWSVSRTIEAFLFDVDRLDPAVWVAAPLALLAVGLVAGVLPARRASRVDPAIALRAE